MTAKTKLRFRWELVAGMLSQSCEVHLLCHNAIRHGVHPPKHWKNELSAGMGLQTVAALADSAIQRVRDEFALSEVVKLDCRLWFVHACALVLGCPSVTLRLPFGCPSVAFRLPFGLPLVALRCVHILHVHGRYVGTRGSASISRPDLIFRWAIALADKIHESEVCVRADNASERGVPFPAAWRSELNIGAARPAVNVDALARAACRRAFEELSLLEDTQLDCRPACA